MQSLIQNIKRKMASKINKMEENEMLKENLNPKPALAISIGAGLCFGTVFGAGFGMIAFAIAYSSLVKKENN